jgi:hypothetical protein
MAANNGGGIDGISGGGISGVAALAHRRGAMAANNGKMAKSEMASTRAAARCHLSRRAAARNVALASPARTGVGGGVGSISA